MCDQVFRDGEVDEDGIDEAGDYWDPDFEYKCNYKMMPVETESPVDDVTKLLETLEEMIDIAKRVDSWESFPSDPIERAEDAIRAYRAQGGDL